jgi:predicted alpha/beta superfamily hydrolase
MQKLLFAPGCIGHWFMPFKGSRAPGRRILHMQGERRSLPDTGGQNLSKQVYNTIRILFIIVFSGFAMGVSAQFSKFGIEGSHVRKFTSSIVALPEYELDIMLPTGYENSNKIYPVLYLMDSQWDFPLVTSLYGQQYFDGFVPEMIIVGITWGGVDPNPDSLRARDYTPTREARSPQSGGAQQYLSVLKNEVIPFIESNYKSNKNDRALAGCSLGGLFTLYAWLTEPGLFQRYIAATPAIGWDKEVIYKYEKKYFESKPAAKARVFICEGGVERGVPAYKKFVKHLADRNYKNVEIQSRILENTGHSGTKGEGYARGLQYVFERPSINPQPGLLKAYAGTYSLPNGNVLQIELEGNQLILCFSANNKFSLKAETEKDFYSTAEFLNIRFMQSSDKGVPGFRLERYGLTQMAYKVK